MVQASQEGRIRQKGKVFRDPVHSLIRIHPADEYILELIDTPEFQRLRRIRQLGVSYCTYHGAEHSRFVHSLGVFNFTQRIVAALELRYAKNKKVIKHLSGQSRALKCAGLLHDLGHAPFSHLHERALDKTQHERQTVRLITSRSTGVYKVLSRHEVDPKMVAEIIEKTSSSRLASDIISSQLDADRMDYLLRDALHTGVEYGNYDKEWIINNLCVGYDPDAPKEWTAERRWRLCLDEARGLHAGEQLILARMHMSHQVYLHRVTRGYEQLVLGIIREACNLARTGKLPDCTPGPIKYFLSNPEIMGSSKPISSVELQNWVGYDENTFLSALHLWATNGKNKPLASLCKGFLNREREYLCREIKKMDIGAITKLENELGKKFIQGIDWSIDEGSFLPYKGLIFSASKEGAESAPESILLAGGDDIKAAVQIETVSKILKLLDFNTHVIKRFYYSRRLAKKIEQTINTYDIW